MTDLTALLARTREVEPFARLVAAKAMGLKMSALNEVDAMWPDLFDLGHGDIFDDICERVEERFGITLTAQDFEGVFSFGDFVEMVADKSLRAKIGPSS